MRVAIYARVSTEAQEARGAIGSQLEALRQRISVENHDLVAEFVDDGLSGTRLDRPGLDGMRDAAETGLIDAVWCLSPDRLARVYAYQVIVLDELARHGVKVFFADAPSIDDDPQARLLTQVQGVIAEYERAKIAERYRRGKLWRSRSGEIVAWKAPYGYRRVARSAERPAHLVVHEPEAVVVRRVFDDFVAGGHSIREITRRLNTDSVATPTGKPVWGTSTVGRLLTNEAYIGTVYWNKTESVPDPRPGRHNRQVRRDRAEWIPIKCTPIVTDDVFAAAQNVSRDNSKWSPRRARPDEWLLRGLIRCGACGVRPSGFEPETCGLRVRCSAVELEARSQSVGEGSARWPDPPDPHFGPSIVTTVPEVDEAPSCRFERPLRIAALVKQIPVGESMTLGEDGRLVRDGIELEMSAYCRRAVSKGVEWARESGGSCTVFTLGPPSAEDVLREAIAWGADRGVHLCDPAFAGSDTLATARALAAALDQEGPFDLVLVGRNSLDGDTGQVGPEIAQLTGLPFATGVRVMGITGEDLSLTLEHDDGTDEVEVSLPALLSVAERLCEPCKVPPPKRAEVPSDRIRVTTAAALGEGPWGQEGSPTRVGRTRLMHHDRAAKVLSGTPAEQAAEAVALLVQRGALTAATPDARRRVPVRRRRGARRRSRSDDRRPHGAGPPSGRSGAPGHCGAPERDHRGAGPRAGLRGRGHRRAGCGGSGCGHHVARGAECRGCRGGRGGMVGAAPPLGAARSEYRVRSGSARARRGGTRSRPGR
jgi:electron transfer flavoprotein alpha/beta subunit/DNA invertase Pin-like site-specific DNA recombinase